MNIKVIIVVCVTISSLRCLGEISNESVGINRNIRIVPLKHSPSDQTNMLIRTGGVLEKYQESLSVCFLNAQDKIQDSRLIEWTKKISAVTRLPIKVISSKQRSKSGQNLAKEALAFDKVGAVIILIQEKEQPSLVIAPEEKWAQININSLMSTQQDNELLEERTLKEIWRAVAFLMGAANSTFEPCLMKPVFSMSDLDALKARSISPEPIRKIAIFAKKMGIEPNIITTYRKACEEGWAPMPTNQYQKAIWEEFQSKKKEVVK